MSSKSRPPLSDPLGAPPAEVFLANLPLIERLAAWICRRSHCTPDEAEEFASEVKLKLVSNDYAALRSYKGDSKLETYLTTVVHNYFKDFRNHCWGKWRPSAIARRLGKLAIKLDELLGRENRSLDDACQILLSRHGELTRGELERLASRLPRRPPRRFEGEDVLEDLPAAEPTPIDRALLGEARTARSRAEALLDEALAALSDEDRLILRMHFYEGLTIAKISRGLCLDQKQLYRRIERMKEDLKARLEAEGMRWDDLRFGFGHE